MIPNLCGKVLAHTTIPLAPPRYDDLAQRFRPVFARIAEGALQREQSRELPFDAVGWLRDAGFGALRVPVAYGGIGATLPQLFRLLVELGEADSNFPQILRAHFALVEGRLWSSDFEAREFWFPKIASGVLVGAAMSERSEVTGGTATLTRQGDDWVLNGEKYYCTGTVFADWIAASAADGDDRVGLAVPVNTPGVVREDDWDGFGQRLTGSGTTRFTNVPIAPANILRRFSEPDPAADSFIKSFYQLVLLATLAGIAKASVRDAIDFVKPRTRAFGVPGKSSPRTDPLVQRVIGRISSLAYAAESLVESVALALEQNAEAHRGGTASESLHIETEIKAFQAQQVVIGQVLEATTLLFEVGGASATSETRRLDRHWRNARTVASHNPAILRERAIGDYPLNGTEPDAARRAAYQKNLSPGEESLASAAESPTAEAGRTEGVHHE